MKIEVESYPRNVGKGRRLSSKVLKLILKQWLDKSDVEIKYSFFTNT